MRAVMRLGAAAFVLALLPACSGPTTARPEDVARYGETRPVSASPLPSSASPQAVSAKDAWLNAADALCAKAVTDGVALGELPTTKDALLDYLRRAAAIQDSLAAHLRTIGGAFASNPDARKIVSLVTEITNDLDAAVAAILNGNLSRAQQMLAAANALADSVVSVGTRLGLSSCTLPGG